MTDIYTELKQRAYKLWDDPDLMKKTVTVSARALTAEEAIGNPDHQDYPIQTGKEKLMQADFLGSYGQAFTDRHGNFTGSVQEVFDMSLTNNYRRAVFIATLNAVLRHLGLAQKTIHCKDKGPVLGAQKLVDHLLTHWQGAKILQIGYQPRIAEMISKEFALRLVDLDPEIIGTTRFNITVEGADATQDAINWADLLLVTGTTIVNNTIDLFLGQTPVIFYGTTIAGAAYLMGWERFCAEAS